MISCKNSREAYPAHSWFIPKLWWSSDFYFVFLVKTDINWLTLLRHILVHHDHRPRDFLFLTWYIRKLISISIAMIQLQRKLRTSSFRQGIPKGEYYMWPRIKSKAFEESHINQKISFCGLHEREENNNIFRKALKKNPNISQHSTVCPE